MNTNQIAAKAGQYLTFSLKSQRYGIPIETVREINSMCEITPIPQTPSFVTGVMDLRGKVIPVVDLRLKFNYQGVDATKETCIVVIDGDEGQIGIIIDHVNEVVELTEEDIRPKPKMGNDEQLSFIIGMGHVKGEITVLIDIVEVLSKENLQQYVEMSEIPTATSSTEDDAQVSSEETTDKVA